MTKFVHRFLYPALAVLFFAFVYVCPVKLISGKDCPACGLSRAFICALKGNFREAFFYHPLFPILGIETAYYLAVHIMKIIKHKLSDKVEILIITITAILLISVWILKQH